MTTALVDMSEFNSNKIIILVIMMNDIYFGWPFGSDTILAPPFFDLPILSKPFLALSITAPNIPIIKEILKYICKNAYFFQHI